MLSMAAVVVPEWRPSALPCDQHEMEPVGKMVAGSRMQLAPSSCFYEHLMLARLAAGELVEV
jgi:hypothetical protein